MLLSCNDRLFAQSVSLKTDFFSISKVDTTIHLGFWVEIDSIRFIDEEESPVDTLIDWTYDSSTGDLKLKLQPDLEINILNLAIHYKRQPFSFSPVIRSRELVELPADSLISEGDTTSTGFQIQQRVSSDDLFGSTNLQRSGSLTRGIIVGSNQDVTLESGLRFELSGNLTDDLEILATLTDQSTPIQPDGTTQNLREFDKVFIQLRNPFGTLQLGDIDISYRNSEFAQIERRLQGIDVQTGLGSYGNHSASAAVVRGRYRTMNLTAREGVQGPYRLSGVDGEQFIIVLAGSERVYINGVRMVRGEENDYIIDYGLGEIQFTNNRLITSDLRITVDFQYVTQAYNRTILAGESEVNDLWDGRLSLGVTYLREGDSRDSQSEFGLSEEEIEILRNAGNDPDRAIISGAESVGFRPNADFVQYALIDTVFQGQEIEVFKNLPGDPRSEWRVRFSRVGDGLGSYRRAQTSVNGIVYEWVGTGNGAYEPFRRLQAPELHQIISLRSEARITSNSVFFGEFAVSDHDRNRFSQIDNNTNTDLAFIGGYRVKPTQTVIGKAGFEARYRHTGANFSFMDRTRDVEFERNWNIQDVGLEEERLAEADFNLMVTEFSGINVSGGWLERETLSSRRQTFRLNSSEPEWPLISYAADFNQSRNNQLLQKGGWFRQGGETSYSIPISGIGITPSFRFSSENRRQRDKTTDMLRQDSFRFYELTPGVAFRFTERFSASSGITYRSDDIVFDGAFIPESESYTYRLTTRYEAENITNNQTITWREKTFLGSATGEIQSQETQSVLIRSETDWRTLNRGLEVNFIYEGGTENRPLLQETFVEVGPELGNYVWIDLNGDGVQQVDEFFPEQLPNEGTFIRQFIPTDEVFSVASVNTRLRTRIEPKNFLDGNSSIARILSNLMLQSTYAIREQNTSGDLLDVLLFNFSSYRDEENTIDGNFTMLQDLHILRNIDSTDLRFTYENVAGLSRRANTLEKTRLQDFRTTLNHRFTRSWSANIILQIGKNNQADTQLNSRSFDIRSRSVEPSFRYDYRRSLQLGGGFSIRNREDVLPQEPAVLNGYSIFSDARWFYQNLIQTTARIEYRSNSIDGASSSFGLFELTEGAGEGNTWSWSVQATYRINEFLRATLNYDGRTLTSQPVAQTMKFTLSAVF